MQPVKLAVAVVAMQMMLSTVVLAGPREQATRLFDRLTGAPLALDDARRAEVESLLASGRPLDAAAIATNDDRFYNVTLKHWSSIMANRDQDPFINVNDMMAMIIGTVRDNRDFREVLYENFTYEADPGLVAGVPAVDPANNNHYDFLENNRINLRSTLIRKEPQRADLMDASGVLTSRGWGNAHLSAGTNRRAVEYAFLEFLCKPVKQLSDPTVQDFHVRRDVERNPGGSTSTYLTSCRGCHAGMDALGGAYAFYEFGGSVTYTPPTVQGKINKNGNVFAAGYVTTDDSWENLWTDNHNAAIGWRGPMSGRGVRQFGQMLSNTGAFSSCMARRVFKQVCNRPAGDEEEGTIQDLGHKFENSNYSLRRLFEEVATLPTCLGN